MTRSKFKFRIDFETDRKAFEGPGLEMLANTPEISTFNPEDPSYDRNKWQDFLVYDLKQELQHNLSSYVESAVKDFLDSAENFNAKKSKKKASKK